MGSEITIAAQYNITQLSNYHACTLYNTNLEAEEDLVRK